MKGTRGLTVDHHLASFRNWLGLIHFAFCPGLLNIYIYIVFRGSLVSIMALCFFDLIIQYQVKY